MFGGRSPLNLICALELAGPGGGGATLYNAGDANGNWPLEAANVYADQPHHKLIRFGAESRLCLFAFNRFKRRELLSPWNKGGGGTDSTFGFARPPLSHPPCFGRSSVTRQMLDSYISVSFII